MNPPGSSLRTHLSSRRGTRRGRIWQVRGGSIGIATEIILAGREFALLHNLISVARIRERADYRARGRVYQEIIAL